MTIKTFHEKNLDKIKELLPELQYGTTLAAAECERLNLPIIITCAYRSQAEEDRLWKIGRDKDGKIVGIPVTWTHNSDHTRRCAIDVLPVGYQRMTTEQVREALNEVASVFATFGIIRPPETLAVNDFGHFSCSLARQKPLYPSPIPKGLKGEALKQWINRRVERLEPSAQARARARLERETSDVSIANNPPL